VKYGRAPLEAGMRSKRTSDSAGFSLIELLIVVAIAICALAGSVLVMPSFVRDARSDGAMKTVIATLRQAKDLAVADRRDMEVRFVAPNEIQIWRQEVPTANGVTQIRSVRLDSNMQFCLMVGVPDTPDGFGNTGAVSFQGATTYIFRTEGMFTDANANLDPISGTLFLGVPNQQLTARAVTVFGPTALIRGYRWMGRQWAE
jgi:prepilin-type N-terminal cleavage/methylation domain-containing protein